MGRLGDKFLMEKDWRMAPYLQILIIRKPYKEMVELTRPEAQNLGLLTYWKKLIIIQFGKYEIQ